MKYHRCDIWSVYQTKTFCSPCHTLLAPIHSWPNPASAPSASRVCFSPIVLELTSHPTRSSFICLMSCGVMRPNQISFSSVPLSSFSSLHFRDLLVVALSCACTRFLCTIRSKVFEEDARDPLGCSVRSSIGGDLRPHCRRSWEVSAFSAMSHNRTSYAFKKTIKRPLSTFFIFQEMLLHSEKAVLRPTMEWTRQGWSKVRKRRLGGHREGATAVSGLFVPHFEQKGYNIMSGQSLEGPC